MKNEMQNVDWSLFYLGQETQAAEMLGAHFIEQDVVPGVNLDE